MGTLRVPGVVPSPDQDCERLKKAFDGMSLCHFVCVCFSVHVCVCLWYWVPWFSSCMCYVYVMGLFWFFCLPCFQIHTHINFIKKNCSDQGCLRMKYDDLHPYFSVFIIVGLWVIGQIFYLLILKKINNFLVMKWDF